MSVKVAILVRRDYWRVSPAPGNSSIHRSVPDIAEAVRRAGAVPEIVFAGSDPHQDFQALIVPGGGDIHPGFYGQTPEAGVALRALEPALDRFQLSWARRALRQGIPVLGICRGMQILNVAAGGTLIQDLPSRGLEHAPLRVLQDPALRPESCHALEVDPDSDLARLLGRSPQGVNSIHHQALDRVAEAFQVVASAPDGTVEAIMGRGPGWHCGVQFHPEDMRERFQPLFERLVEQGAAYTPAA